MKCSLDATKRKEKEEEELKDLLLKKIWERVEQLSDDRTALEVYADLRSKVYYRDVKAFINQVYINTRGPYIRFRGRDVSDGSVRTWIGRRLPLALLEDIYSQTLAGLKVVSGLIKSKERGRR